MQFLVEISETLTRIVSIEADSPDEALLIARQQYRDELVVLDSKDFQEVTFNIYEDGAK